jgi:hypothetical protein
MTDRSVMMEKPVQLVPLVPWDLLERKGLSERKENREGQDNL